MSPLTVERRVSKIEDALEKHLIESGEIRTDLSWLKKAFWTLVGLTSTEVITRLFHI